ncbi:MAG: hypothetical protein GY756_17715 [bacterium]|nr:hypothetical protein [bacterium]
MLDYFKMRAKYFDTEKENAIVIRISDLDSFWNCSHQNVKRKLKKFVDINRIQYTPGRGRGNYSTIIFMNSFHNEILTFVKTCISTERLDKIIILFKLPIPDTWISEIVNEISLLFGNSKNKELKDVLRTSCTEWPSTLDPIFSRVRAAALLQMQIGDTLVHYDEIQDTVKPNISHHWESNGNHTVWSFHLRKNIKFHNGRIMTSEDVRHSFKRFNNKKSQYSWFITILETIECPSELLVIFKLKKPNPFFIRYVCCHALIILPKNEVFNENRFIASGPFMLKSRTDTKIVLECHKDYFRECPQLDIVEFYKIPNSKIQENFTQKSNNYLSEDMAWYLMFNFNKRSIIQNPYFREAMFNIVDIKKMSEDIKNESIVEASSYHCRYKCNLVKDESKINGLLNLSDYDSEIISMYVVVLGKKYKAKAEWISTQAASYGIRMKITYCLLFDLYSKSVIEDADIIYYGSNSDADIYLALIIRFRSNLFPETTFFDKKHLSDIQYYIEEIESAKTSNARELGYKNVENYIRNNNLMIFINHPIVKKHFGPVISNIKPLSNGLTDIKKIWIDKPGQYSIDGVVEAVTNSHRVRLN